MTEEELAALVAQAEAIAPQAPPDWNRLYPGVSTGPDQIMAEASMIDPAAQPAQGPQAAYGQGGLSMPPQGIPERLADNLIGLDNGVMSAGEQVAAALNSGGESMTFGVVGDEAAGQFDEMIGRGLADERTQFYRDQQDDLREANPALALGAEVGGALVGPGAALRFPGNLAARMGLSGLLGAAGGTTYGYMEGDGTPQERQDSAWDGGIIGGAIGAAIPAVGAGVQRVANAVMNGRAMRTAARGAPTTDALRALGDAEYRAVDDAGVQISPDAFSRMWSETTDNMRGLDRLPGPGSLTPSAARVTQIGNEMGEQMAQQADAALPFSSLDQLRQHASTAAMAQQPRDASLGAQMIGRLDDFVENLGPADVLDGDIDALRSAIPRAREIWGRMRRSELLDDAMEEAGNYRSGETVGLRAQFQRILRTPALRRGFSDEELTAIRRVVNGSLPEHLVHLLGNGLGNTMAVATGVGAGAASGGPIGGLIGGALGSGVAMGTRAVSNAIIQRNAQRARDLVANNGLRGVNVPQITDQTRNVAEALLRRLTRPAMVGP